MLKSLTKKLCQDVQAVAAVEFALFAPLFLLLFNITAEFTMMIHQVNVIEKSIFAGTLLAAEAEYPIDGNSQIAVENFVKYGNVAGTGDYIIPGWADEDATYSLTTEIFNLNDDLIPVINITVSVPYAPSFPTLNFIENFTGATFDFSHEQLVSL